MRFRGLWQASGERHDIETTLLETEGGWSLARAATDLVLSHGGERTFAERSQNGRDLAWRWTSTLPAPVIDDSTATYVGMAPGEGDLVVTATATGFSYDAKSFRGADDPSGASGTDWTADVLRCVWPGQV